VVAAFPAFTTILTIAVARAGGWQAGGAVLGGLIRGLSAYCAFTLAVAVLAGQVTIGIAVAVGLALSLLTAWVSWKARHRTAREVGLPRAGSSTVSAQLADPFRPTTTASTSHGSASDQNATPVSATKGTAAPADLLAAVESR